MENFEKQVVELAIKHLDNCLSYHGNYGNHGIYPMRGGGTERQDLETARRLLMTSLEDAPSAESDQGKVLRLMEGLIKEEAPEMPPGLVGLGYPMGQQVAQQVALAQPKPKDNGQSKYFKDKYNFEDNLVAGIEAGAEPKVLAEQLFPDLSEEGMKELINKSLVKWVGDAKLNVTRVSRSFVNAKVKKDWVDNLTEELYNRCQEALKEKDNG